MLIRKFRIKKILFFLSPKVGYLWFITRFRVCLEQSKLTYFILAF